MWLYHQEMGSQLTHIGDRSTEPNKEHTYIYMYMLSEYVQTTLNMCLV